MDLFCVRLETQCLCKIGCMLRSLRESDKREKAFSEQTYGKNNIFSGFKSGRENQKASRLQGGTDRRMIADCKARKADQLPTLTRTASIYDSLLYNCFTYILVRYMFLRPQIFCFGCDFAQCPKAA
jgi:hypothetical protein